MRFKKSDYFIVGGIVAAVWLLALARSDRSENKNFRPVGGLSQCDDQHLASDFEGYSRVVDSKPVVHTQRAIPNTRPPRYDNIPQYGNVPQPRREFPKMVRSLPRLAPANYNAQQVVNQAIVFPEPELVEPAKVEPELIWPELVEPKLVEPKLVEPKLVKPQPVEPALAQQELVEPELPQLEMAERESVQPELDEPQALVHAQNLIVVASSDQQLRRYELPTGIESQVTPTQPLTSNTENTERFADESLRKQPPAEQNRLGLSGPRLVKNRFITTPAQQSTVQLNSESSNLQVSDTQLSGTQLIEAQPSDLQLPVASSRGDFHVGQASTSEYSFESSDTGDFQIPLDQSEPEIDYHAQPKVESNIHHELESNIQPDRDPQTNRESNFQLDRESNFQSDRGSQPDWARNAKMVRKANWEEIQPDSELTNSKNRRAGFPALVRHVSQPETELRSLAATNQGKALATRGAYFGAKEEFMNALRIIAQSNDRASGSRDYTTSLLAGFTALKESEDFATTPQSGEHSRNLNLVMASHETNVIQRDQVDLLSFNQASEAYCQFAQIRIEQAIGESKAGSYALFHLSRILSTAPELRGETGIEGDNTKRAILLASLTAAPSNYEAANELGVLFFDEAWYKPAVHWFTQAVKASGGKQLFWRNLAEAHNRLANTTQIDTERATNLRLAHLANQEATLAPQMENSGIPLAGWVSPEHFQRNSAIPAPSFNQQIQQVPVSTAQIQAVQTVLPVKQRRKLPRLKDWF